MVKFETGTKEDVLNYFDSLLDSEDIDAFLTQKLKKLKKNEDGLFEIYAPKTHYYAKK